MRSGVFFQLSNCFGRGTYWRSNSRNPRDGAKGRVVSCGAGFTKLLQHTTEGNVLI